jgi:hypothetical protein
LIVRVSSLLQVCKAASRRCPGWRRRRPASVFGACLEESQTNSFSFSHGCLSHSWLGERVFIVRSIWLQVGNAASRRCPSWRRRLSASDQGSAARRQSCQSLDGGVEQIFVLAKGCLIHCWLSERLYYQGSI